MSLRRALFLVVAAVLVLGVVPAGLLLSRQLEQTLVDRAHDDLHRAGMVLGDRWEAVAGARMMHAQELSRVPGLAEAIVSGDHSTAERVLTDAASAFAELPILVSTEGDVLAGPLPAPMELVEATARGEMPVAVVGDGPDLHLVALAPVKLDGEWIGAAGGATPFTDFEAATLSGLTRSDVVIVAPDQNVAASSGAIEVAPAIAQGMVEAPLDSVQVIERADGAVLALAAPVVGEARVIFVRDLAEELSVLPALRGTALAVTGAALLLALLMGSLFAGVVARPVGSLASAADRLAAGDMNAPVKGSAITEVNRMAEAFDAMRLALSTRVQELEAANQELADRQERLTRLQGELIQRERRASTNRLVSQLAHEIRNPVASVRNCLELLRRRVDTDPEGARFADMAIDELLRMHELAEQMLQVHRSGAEPEARCDASEVANEVASLVDAGSPSATGERVRVHSEGALVGMAADDLKQVFFNLVLNAREAAEGEGAVEIVITPEDDRVRLEVLDRGPGIPDDVLPRVFDPFFTTKEAVQGVGLGLFTAEAIVRMYGGRIAASNRTDGPGARFTVEAPPPTPPQA